MMEISNVFELLFYMIQKLFTSTGDTEIKCALILLYLLGVVSGIIIYTIIFCIIRSIQRKKSGY